MPDVLGWRADDLPALLDRAYAHLQAGRLVALPTEAGYEAVASALHPDAVAELADLAGPQEPLALLLGEATEVFDWLPSLRGPGLRLLRSFWPGPLILVSDAGVGLARRLPAAVQRHLCQQGRLALRLPDHDWPGPLRRRLDAPLVSVSLPGFPQEVAAIGPGRERLALILDGGPSPFVKPPSVVAAEGKAITVLREGAVPRPDLEAAVPCRILFVCTGNTCRSPLAEALCRTLLSAKLRCAAAELAGRGYVVESAGLAAGPGNPATPEAVTIAQAYGADLAAHASRPLSLDLLSRADFLFTMTGSQWSILRSLRVPGAPTPQLLDSAGADVEDPIGGSAEIYRVCAAQIWQYLNERLAELLE